MLCTVDLGTTGIKAGLFSSTGQLLASVKNERSIQLPGPGLAEQSLNEGWDLMCTTVRQVIANSGVSADQVEAVALSTQRGTVLAVDKDEKPLDNLILWMDRRGLTVCKWLKEEIGQAEYYSACGHPINPYVGISKLRWIHDARPEMYERVYKFLPEHSLYHRWLGAESLVCDTATASFFGPLNIRAKTWHSKMLLRVGLDETKMPALAPATQIIGQLSTRAAEQCDLKPGTTLVLGGGDGQCAGVGSGTVEEGRVMINIGTGTGVQAYLPAVKMDPNHTLNCGAHILPYAWEMEGHTQASGVVYRWVRDQLATVEMAAARKLGKDPYDLLTREADGVPAGADGLLFLPSYNGLSAPIDYPDARGAFLGLTLRHTRAHLVRAVIEGILLEIRWLLEAIGKAGVDVEEIRVVGGPTVSPIWNQLLADILQRPVSILEIGDATMLGAAQCAAVSLGYFKDFQESARAWVKVQSVFEPDRSLAGLYNDLFALFCESYQMMVEIDLFGRIAAIERMSADIPSPSKGSYDK